MCSAVRCARKHDASGSPWHAFRLAAPCGLREEGDRMTFRRRALTAAVLALLAACASVQMAAPARDDFAKEFAHPSKGKAALYVFRDGSMGSAIKMTLELDGALLGET